MFGLMKLLIINSCDSAIGLL